MPTFPIAGAFSPFDQNGLDYESIERKPIRDAAVQLVNECDTVIAQSNLNSEGEYSFSTDYSGDVKVRVLAEISREFPGYFFQVVDNTQGDALYSLVSAFINTTAADAAIEQNLHADSGWTGSNYSNTRAAAPFAILDTILLGLEHFKLHETDRHLEFAKLKWSPSNSGASFYNFRENSITIIGAQDEDTDEYDRSVVLHEFGHLLEGNISKLDSIGGAHTGNQKLDLRLASSEGFADAVASEVLQTPFYIDTGGDDQSSNNLEKDLRLETQDPANAGWFNEASLANIYYEYSASEANAFEKLLWAISTSDYISSPSLSSIFTISEAVIANFPETASVWTQLGNNNDVELENNDSWGSNETNDGDTPNVLPIFPVVEANGGAVSVCSNNENRYPRTQDGTDRFETNKLGFRAFARADIPAAGNYTISVNRTSGFTISNPIIIAYQRGKDIDDLTSPTDNVDININSASLSDEFLPGFAVFEIFPTNVSPSDPNRSVCYDLTVTSS